MTLYDLRRYFGFMPEPSEEAYVKGPDQFFSTLRSDYIQYGAGDSLIASMVSFALKFDRLDIFYNTVDVSEWGQSATACLYRGRLRFFQALADDPGNPDQACLARAAEEFRRAAGSGETAWEALAGLIRIYILLEGVSSGRRRLRRFIFKSSRRGWAAAAGVCLFLAERPGVSQWISRYYLWLAHRLFGWSGARGVEDRLVRVEIKERLGKTSGVKNQLLALEAAGSLEARLYRIRRDVNLLLQSSGKALPEGLFGELRHYRKERPSDSRSYVAEGDLSLAADSELARMAWQSALIIDDRCAEAWSRLGDLYQSIWDCHGNETACLDGAVDSYKKAVALAPLNPIYRLSLGIVEQESGRPNLAVIHFQSALALSIDNSRARRRLAACWIDLTDSQDLPPAGQTAAASKALIEWRRLYRQSGSPLDLLGLLRSMVLEGAPTGDYRDSLEELLRIFPDEDIEQLLGLVEDLIHSNRKEDTIKLLDRIEKIMPNDPRILAYRAEVQLEREPKEAYRLYREAAYHIDSGAEAFVHWTLGAAAAAVEAGMEDMAESVLKESLNRRPGVPALVQALSVILHRQGRISDAADAYADALRRKPLNREILEDALWFFRSIGQADEAGKWLIRALEEAPADAGLWNQFGIHHMETGWDEFDDSIQAERLNEGISAYRRAVDLSPGNPVYRANLGDALRQAGKWSESEDLLKQVGDEPFAVNALARLEDERSYATEGSEATVADWDAAGRHYREAAEAASQNSDFQRDCAWWLYRERRLDEAIQFYRRGAAADPLEALMPYGESMCHRELGNEAAALAALDKALALGPGDPVMLADRADVLVALGTGEKAEEIYGEVLRLTKGAVWAWERLARLREQQAQDVEGSQGVIILPSDSKLTLDVDILMGKISSERAIHWRKEALQAWESALKTEPGNRELMARIGAAWMVLGRLDKAREYFQASLERRGASATALNGLGRLYLIEGIKGSDESLAKSETHFLKALEANSRQAAYHADLGLIYFLQDRWNDAFTAYSAAAEKDSEHPEYAGNAGVCAYKCKRFDESIQFIQKALEVNNDMAEWQNVLGLAFLGIGAPDAALEAFRAACLDDPANESFTANLAMAHAGLRLPEGPIQ